MSDNATVSNDAVRSNRRMMVLVLLLFAVMSVSLIRDYTHYWTTAKPRIVTPRGDLAGSEKSRIELFRNASPSVVHITTLEVRRNALNLNLYQIPQGTGSGIVWDDHGHIVTNFHVVQNADVAKVMLADHTTWPATLVGFAADKDLAVLRIHAPRNSLFPIPIGTSNDLEVGQEVLAIGNPFGLDRTLTTGVISALGREIESVTDRPIRDVIQTDAAINPGNSGGPLLDSVGRLIGVNTAIYSPNQTAGFSGIGFAIPVDTVNSVAQQLIAHGKVIRPGLGISTAPDQVGGELGLVGVLILDVFPETSAEASKLRPTRRDASGGYQFGDVIVAIDGVETPTLAKLRDVLEAHKIGDEVTVLVLRDGKRTEVNVTLQET